MADDARISTALPNHPKTKKLKKRLGLEGCWSLVCLFLWTAENRWSGDLEGMSDEDIELAADWEGQAGELVKAMVVVGFLDGESERYKVHDWEEHNPFAATKGTRIQRAKDAANKKWANVRDAIRMQAACDQHANGMQQPESSNAHHTTPHHDTPPKKPSREKPREADSRFSPIREFIEKCCKHASVPFVWEAAEGMQLSRWLKAAPGVDLEGAKLLIRNRFRSKDPPGKRPCKWIPYLSDYATGPLDRFNKLDEGDGDRSTDEAARILGLTQPG